MDQVKNVKRLYSEERKKPYITLNRTKQTTLYKNWVRNGDRKEKGKTTKTKNSNAKEPYESGKIKLTVTKDKQPGERRP